MNQDRSKDKIRGRPSKRAARRTSRFEGELIAFSLKNAERQILETGCENDIRNEAPTLFSLGGIRRIHGAVYDRDSKDIILVGRADPQRRPLTIDDFVVALRARFLHRDWPMVSIDAPHEGSGSDQQPIRFGGGIENTRFGKDLFDADYRLKLIAMGYLHSGVSGMPTYWDLSRDESTLANSSVYTRFWFYPVVSNVAVRTDVAAISDLRVELLTEHRKKGEDGGLESALPPGQAAVEFSKIINEYFLEIGNRHDSIARLAGLEELVAITLAIDRLQTDYDFSHWLHDYHVEIVSTLPSVKLVSRIESGYGMSGGVQLMALALRLKSGDVSALREAVLGTRPDPNSLTWTFSVGEWVIPTSSGSVDFAALSFLYAQSKYFQQMGLDKEALDLLDKLAGWVPDNVEVHQERAKVLERLQEHQAASEALEKAQQLLANRAIPPLDGIFVSAAVDGDHVLLLRSLAAGVDVNARGTDGFTAIIGAAQNGHEVIVRTLLDRQGDPTIASFLGSTALTLAASRGHRRIVAMLLDRGADVNQIATEGNTALLAACQIGDYDTASLLLARGAKIDVANENGYTALTAATAGGHSECAKLLLDHGAHISKKDADVESPVLWAIGKKRIGILRLLLERGFNPSVRGTHGATALHIATLRGNIEAVELLLEHGADVNAKEDSISGTSLMLAKDLKIAEILIESGADIEARGHIGQTALHVVADREQGDTSCAVMQLLLTKGANVHASTRDGITPLIVAAASGHIRAVEVLLSAGARAVTKSNQGKTAFDYAREAGHDDVMSVLGRK